MRKLASVQRIRQILPIDGADAIELVQINSWKVVVAKNANHQVGELVVYFEIDSFLPVLPEFEFLRKSSFRIIGDEEGFRIRTLKLRGQISQGLILSIGEAQSMVNPKGANLTWEEGEDVTDALGVVKFEPPIPTELAGLVKGPFPGFLRKTDEERIQNLTDDYSTWVTFGSQFYFTEKLDGTSATFYHNNGDFGVCSRNLELLASDTNAIWRVARALTLEEKLQRLGKNLCLQGELIGEGIQGNRYGIKGLTVRFFNAFDMDNQQLLPLTDFLNLTRDLGIETVPVLQTNIALPETIIELLTSAEGKSALNSKVEREGLVIRSQDSTISFKVISNRFLLKHED